MNALLELNISESNLISFMVRRLKETQDGLVK